MAKVTAYCTVSMRCCKGQYGVTHRIEKTTRHPKEDPDIDHERETERQSNVGQNVRGETVCRISGGIATILRPRIRHLRAGKGEEEEHSRAHELGNRGDKV